ncbi:hypothetical protein NOR53_471 [gamma proteobacterium NOR5-3]|nr:hypothetical protein NOR53_471 [gamma proteobacterium NOR5-3]
MEMLIVVIWLILILKILDGFAEDRREKRVEEYARLASLPDAERARELQKKHAEERHKTEQKGLEVRRSYRQMLKEKKLKAEKRAADAPMHDALLKKLALFLSLAIFVVLGFSVLSSNWGEQRHTQRQEAINSLAVCLELNRTAPKECNEATSAVDAVAPDVVATIARIAESKQDVGELIHYLRVVD